MLVDDRTYDNQLKSSIKKFDSKSSFDVNKAYQTLQKNPKLIDMERVYEWWFRRSPSNCYLFLACVDDLPVACATAQDVLGRADGESLFAVEIGNTVTDENYRRQGLFSKLVAEVVSTSDRRGAEFIFGTPNLNSTPAYSKLGWEILWEKESWLLKTKPSIIKTEGLKTKVVIESITKEQYIKERQDHIDSFVVSARYLNWRFGRVDAPHCFMKIVMGTETVWVAFRLGSSGVNPPVILSDWVSTRSYLNQEPDLLLALQTLHENTGRSILFHSSTCMLNDCDKASIYRPFPLCLKRLKVNSIPKIFSSRNFKLSYCDFG